MYVPACGRWDLETPLELWGISDHKLKAFFYETAFKNFLDSAVICHFYPYEYHHMVDALNGAGGWDMDADEINQVGERIQTTARLYLNREGFTKAGRPIISPCLLQVG